MSILDRDDREVLHVAMESRAAWFGAAAHGAQMHGTRRYRQHLIEVRDVLAMIFERVRMRIPPDLRQAVWLHDTIEDTDITDTHLLELFSPEVVQLVVTVTARGGNRKSRVAVKAKRLRESMLIAARILAMADRIANVRCSTNKATQNLRLLQMYVQEAEDFNVAVALEVAHGFSDAHLMDAYHAAAHILETVHDDGSIVLSSKGITIA